VTNVQTPLGTGSRTKHRVLWFFGIVLLFPTLAAVYLVSAPPQSYAGSNYKVVDLQTIVGRPVAPTAGGEYTDQVRSLDGKLIAIEGEMLVPDGGHLASNEFLLIDRLSNPSGSVKSPWQYVLVRMPPDKKAQRIVAPMQMYGTFHAKTRCDETGRVTSIYELDADWMLVR
jgi:hypothetical protein